MIAHPEGWLRRISKIVRSHQALLIADEVMTGFGRTGSGHLFACHREGVQPDFLNLAKGLTAGYLPMGATLTTRKVFEEFLGHYEEFKTFFHGHSYTGNQLGSAVARASLELLIESSSVNQRHQLESEFARRLDSLWAHPQVGDIRRAGLIAGVELVRDWRTRQPFKLTEQVGIQICDEMRKQGVLTRPIGNVIVLMPPYCTTSRQVGKMIGSLDTALRKTFA